MTIRLLILMAVSNAAFAACIPTTASRILGRDLALADPRFSVLPGILAVGFAPSPGAQRIYSPAELQRIARVNGIQLNDVKEICFEVRMRPFTAEDATTAMRRSLPPDASVSIEELSKSDLPAGQIEFPLTGLDPPAPGNRGIQLWHGFVRYAETQKMACWARVRVIVHYTAVVAVRDLQAGQPLDPAALTIEDRAGPLERQPTAMRLEQIRGRELKHALRAGSSIPLGLLIEPLAVRQGDFVRVEVQSGPARLHFEAVAEGPAREGDLIELRNPTNGKTFRARLSAGRQVVIVIGGGQKL